MNQEKDLARRIERVLCAACVGDALGAVTEAMHPQQILEIFGKPVMTLLPAPIKAPFAHGLPLGHLTDDGTQMLAMVERLVAIGRQPTVFDVVDGLLSWAKNEEIFSRFAGPTTRLAVERLRSGTPVLEVATSESYSCSYGTSNGAAMRAPAAGCARIGDVIEAAKLACLLAAPTHNTQIAYEGAGAVAGAIAAGLGQENPDFDLNAMVAAALEGAQIGLAQARIHGRLAGGAGVTKRLELAVEIGQRFVDDMAGAVDELTQIVGNGVAMAEAVPHAFGLIAAARGDPWQVIVSSVNGGNDSDTIAMIAGSIAASWWPDDAMPEKIADEVAHVNVLNLRDLATKLAALKMIDKEV